MDWSKKLDAALWAYRTAFKTPISMSPFRLIFGKPFHFPLELEHRGMWAIRNLNFNLKEAGEKRLLQLNELEEMCNDVSSTKLCLIAGYSKKQRLYSNVVHDFFSNLLTLIMFQPLAIDFELLSIFRWHPFCTIWG